MLSTLPTRVLQNHLLPFLCTLPSHGAMPTPVQCMSTQRDAVFFGCVNRKTQAMVRETVLKHMEVVASIFLSQEDKAKLLQRVKKKYTGYILKEYFDLLTTYGFKLRLRWFTSGEDEDGEYEEKEHVSDCCVTPDEALAAFETFRSGSTADRETGQRSCDLELWSSDERQLLAKMPTFWWEDNATLMHLNMLSQDLADFSRGMYKCSDMDIPYSDMAIEFGESQLSGVHVNMLLAQALEGDLSLSTLYLKPDPVQYRKPQNPLHMEILLKKAVQAFQGSYVIGHSTDLPPGLRFSGLPGWQRLYDDWYGRAPTAPLDNGW